MNLYLNEAKKQNDSTDILNYSLIQSQVYHDLGDYYRSLAISKELYPEIQNMDMTTKTILLELMDQCYGKLKVLCRADRYKKGEKGTGDFEECLLL